MGAMTTTAVQRRTQAVAMLPAGFFPPVGLPFEQQDGWVVDRSFGDLGVST